MERFDKAFKEGFIEKCAEEGGDTGMLMEMFKGLVTPKDISDGVAKIKEQVINPTAKGLGAAGAGTLAGAFGGYGIGTLLGKGISDPPIARVKGPGEINKYYEERRKQDAKRKAIRNIVAALGVVGGGVAGPLLYDHYSKV